MPNEFAEDSPYDPVAIDEKTNVNVSNWNFQKNFEWEKALCISKSSNGHHQFEESAVTNQQGLYLRSRKVFEMTLGKSYQVYEHKCCVFYCCVKKISTRIVFIIKII
ncbi:hypothetical protein MtrunA17_Chr4g0006701 [Medicago truncatula]|uniref:Uncharacterized protein n=2 Tax=Medicago truncatula TaxID=3880 RepID=A0A396I3P8_MEDTR|nr:hypothetical protein MtrunA17_Chr4g0006701 [Medicago truncatula]